MCRNCTISHMYLKEKHSSYQRRIKCRFILAMTLKVKTKSSFSLIIVNDILRSSEIDELERYDEEGKSI